MLSILSRCIVLLVFFASSSSSFSWLPCHRCQSLCRDIQQTVWMWFDVLTSYYYCCYISSFHFMLADTAAVLQICWGDGDGHTQQMHNNMRRRQLLLAALLACCCLPKWDSHNKTTVYCTNGAIHTRNDPKANDIPERIRIFYYYYGHEATTTSVHAFFFFFSLCLECRFIQFHFISLVCFCPLPLCISHTMFDMFFKMTSTND